MLTIKEVKRKFAKTFSYFILNQKKLFLFIAFSNTN